AEGYQCVVDWSMKDGIGPCEAIGDPQKRSGQYAQIYCPLSQGDRDPPGQFQTEEDQKSNECDGQSKSLQSGPNLGDTEPGLTLSCIQDLACGDWKEQIIAAQQC